MGGSAAMGDPEPAYGMPRVLQALWELRFPDSRCEVINAAVTAVNSHVVAQIARDCRQLDADAWVIYVGNNEVAGPFGPGTVFGGSRTPLWLIRSGLALKRTRTGQLLAEWGAGDSPNAPTSWGGMKMFLAHQVRHNDPALQRVYQNFQANLSSVLGTARGVGTPVVISTVVSNLRDSPPFASLNAIGLPEERKSAWKQHYDTGCGAQTQGEYERAIKSFQAAAEIDDSFAELQFRWAQCEEARGNRPSARKRYRLARDYDTLRFRADSHINQVIRDVAGKRAGPATVFVDAESEFASRAGEAIVGDQYLLEHVHFRFAGNYLLAKLFADKLMDIWRMTPPAKSSVTKDVGPDGWPTLEACARRLGFTHYHQLLLTRELKGRFMSPPFSSQLGHQQRANQLDAQIAQLSASLDASTRDEAIATFRDLLKIHRDDWILRKQFSLLLASSGDIDGSVQQHRLIVEQLPHHAEAHFLLGKLLNQKKDWPAAEASLLRALTLRPDFARVHNSLGITYSHMQQVPTAYQHFARAVQLQPSFAEAYYNWGLVLASQDDMTGALQKYEQAVVADANYLPRSAEARETLCERTATCPSRTALCGCGQVETTRRSCSSKSGPALPEAESARRCVTATRAGTASGTAQRNGASSAPGRTATGQTLEPALCNAHLRLRRSHDRIPSAWLRCYLYGLGSPSYSQCFRSSEH